MGVKAGSHTACTLGTIILFIAVTGNGRQQFIIGYFIFNRIVFDVMSLIIQGICIGFDLCIKSTQVLSGGVVYFNVILRAGWLIIVIERTACYQLVGSRSIRRRGVCTCSERTCTKSLAPVVFATVLGRCCSILVLDRLFVLIKLYIAICIRLIDFDVVTNVGCIFFSVLLQLFHDDNVVVINTVGYFDEAVIIRRCIGIFLLYRFRRLCIVICCTIVGICLISIFIFWQLFPFISITGFITCIMAKRNRSRFIRGCLVA